MNVASRFSHVDRCYEFALNPGTQIPEDVLRRIALLLVDTLAVAAAATTLDAGRIARETVALSMQAAPGAPELPMLFDGRPASPMGAAFAAATQIDNLDAHDGYNPTKGHIGCALVPALFAFATERPDLGGPEALRALVVGYEVAARAAVSLHATTSDYHTSGAWNALGVVAMGCRLLGLDHEVMRQALGIAEYHGPRSQMMREIATPTMLHDGSGMGALVGVMSTDLARRGFHGAPAITLEKERVAPYWRDLGSDWTVLKNYIKPYPTCRWTHAPLDALHGLMQQHGFGAGDVRRMVVRTFSESAALWRGMPTSTGMAQYALPFPMAVMLRYGRVGAEHVSGPALSDPETAALLGRIEVIDDPRHSSRFPAGRWADVSVELIDGRVLGSGDVHASGGPEAPMPPERIRAKFDALCAVTLSPSRARAIWDTGHALTDPASRLSDLTALVTRATDH